MINFEVVDVTRSVCDGTCHCAHYWDMGLMCCQRCGGLIVDEVRICRSFESWGKSNEIEDYLLKLERRKSRMES